MPFCFSSLLMTAVQTNNNGKRKQLHNNNEHTLMTDYNCDTIIFFIILIDSYLNILFC